MKNFININTFLFLLLPSILFSETSLKNNSRLTLTTCSVIIEAGLTNISTTNYDLDNYINDGNQYKSVRVRFSSANLHAKSYLLITSIEDGACQKLNTESMTQWRNLSAALNGKKVKIELYKHYQDPSPSFTVDGMEANSIKHTGTTTCSDYTPNDDLTRIPSFYASVGRLRAKVYSTNPTESGGTGWISSNGTLIGPGHGVDATYYTQYIEFNVPSSDPDGALNHPSPDDQYAIDYSSIQRQNNGSGLDWAVFKVFRNSNTGLLPHEKQKSFLRVIKDGIPTYGTKVGFGLDVYPVGTAGGGNSSHNTQQQTSISNVVLSSISRLSFSGVVDGKDSGSPMIHNTHSAAFGIVTHCGAYGTAFTNINLENSLNNIYGTNVTYVDNNHPSSNTEGSITRPYNNIFNGVQNSSSNDLLLVTKGYYNESIIINKRLTINAPVGSVIIGKSGSSSKVLPFRNSIKETPNEETPQNFSLDQNFPNPFNPETTINYSLSKDSKVNLKVYNLIGQEVLTLVNEYKNIGNYSVRFNTRSLPSGVYFYILTAGAERLTKSMTIIK